jgi:UMF1 family MFS transporter
VKGVPVSEARQDNRAIWSWALYDFANSPFTTLIVTFIYATYFANAIAPDDITGTALWSRAVAISAIVVALLSPLVGALADRGGYRKRFLLISTAICIVATVALYPVMPGQVIRALAMFIVANIAFEMGMVFYNAFLPDIAPANRIGRISGYGWGLGYIGGLLGLVGALVMFVQPEVPWFGISKDGGENIRAICLMVAAWFTVFSVPIFLWVKEDRSEVTQGGNIVRASFGQLASTFRELKRYRQITRFLLARLIYNDGLITVFAFGGIYAQNIFGFEMQEVLVFGIAINFAAGTSAFVFGRLDDRMGGKRTLVVTVWGLMAAALLAALAPNRATFWVASIIAGIFAGPNQAASRSLMGRFVPDDKENEFFGFFAFSGKATAFLGPLLYGIMTQAFNTQRAGIATVALFLVVGLVLLLRVDEAEGIATADRAATN